MLYVEGRTSRWRTGKVLYVRAGTVQRGVHQVDRNRDMADRPESIERHCIIIRTSANYDGTQKES